MKYLKSVIAFIFVVVVIVVIVVVVNFDTNGNKKEEPWIINSISYNCESKNRYAPGKACRYSILTKDLESIDANADSIERLCYKLDDENVACDIEIGTKLQNGDKKIQYVTCASDRRSYYCGWNLPKDEDRLSDAEILATDVCNAYLNAERREDESDNKISLETINKNCRNQRYLTENGYMEEEEYDQIVDTGQELR